MYFLIRCNTDANFDNIQFSGAEIILWPVLF